MKSYFVFSDGQWHTISRSLSAGRPKELYIEAPKDAIASDYDFEYVIGPDEEGRENYWQATLNATKVSNREAAEVAGAATALEERKQAMRRDEINCGLEVIAYIRYRNNEGKTLTFEQDKLIIAATREIAEALHLGNLKLAKNMLADMVADGTLITQADLDAADEKLDMCIAMIETKYADVL